MISPQLLDSLRCPLDPRNTRLDDADDALICQRCRLAFPVRDGIPCLLPEEAALPTGYTSLAALPCQTQTPAAPENKP